MRTLLSPVAQAFCQKLQIELPIIQAPMAGHVVTTELIAAVQAAGGLGSLALGYLTLDEMKLRIRQTKSKVHGPFAVNIFIPEPISMPDTFKKEQMLQYINRYRNQLELEPLTELKLTHEIPLDEIIELILSEDLPILSFTFGTLSSSNIKRLHQKGVFIIGTATHLKEALALEAIGCDAVVAQGYEAGGHRGGGFLKNNSGALIGSMALIPQMADKLKIPVIAAGGIMDGRGVVAAMNLGASAVQMGTAFLTCHESQCSATYKQALLESSEDSTCITSVYTGKPVRCLKNTFICETEQSLQADDILPYPLQHYATQALRAKANQFKRTDIAGFWGGQGSPLCTPMHVSELFFKIKEEMKRVIYGPQ